MNSFYYRKNELNISQLKMEKYIKIVFQVLEKGNDYSVYSLKGMELQETSCHNLEATRVDDIFNKTFDQVF